MTTAPDRTTAQQTQLEAQQMHLTEAQLDDHLIGDLAPPAASHLALCSFCAARVAEAASPLSSFRAVTLAWGERQSATAPIPQSVATPNQWQRSLAWSLAVAACAVGLGLANLSRNARQEVASPNETAYAEQQSTPSADQLSSDNQLLNTIDSEVSPAAENSATLGLVSLHSPRPAASQASLIRASLQD